MPTTRWQAFLIHLGSCAVLYAVLLYFIVFHWYPQPYFAADGGWLGVQIVTGVDLVLGPVLTLLVYRRGKRGLKFDLALIAVFQAVAMVWGTWIVYDQRTAAVVFASGRFNTLNSDQIADAGEHALKVVSESTTHPPYVFVRMPAGTMERIKVTAWAANSGIPLSMLGDRYEPLNAANRTAVLESAIDIEKRVAVSDEDRAALDAFLARHGGQSGDYAFVTLSTRYRFLLLALRRDNGAVVDTLDIRPTARLAPPQAKQPSS